MSVSPASAVMSGMLFGSVRIHRKGECAGDGVAVLTDSGPLGVIHPVAEPGGGYHKFTTRPAMLVVGASSPEGAERGIAALLRTVR